MTRRSAAAITCSVLLLAAIPALAQSTQPVAAPDFGIDQKYLRTYYTKSEFRIPMRDGTRLHTAVYAPKNATTKLPIIFTRTPYGIGGYGPDEWPEPKNEMKWFGKDGFIFVLQDVRGRYKSEGTFVHVRPIGLTAADERTDAWDTIDWIVRHVPNNNGRVGMTGMSYPGFYTSCAMIDPHPALKCVIPQAPVADWFEGDDVHRNGAFNIHGSYVFLRSFGTIARGQPLDPPDPYDFFLKLGSPGHAPNLDKPVGFWDEVLTHPNYDDYWKARDIRPHLKNIPIPVMTVGGWYDAEDLFGTLDTYRHVERNNPSITNVLVMGPWFHGAWLRTDGSSLGDIQFGSQTAYHFLRNVELPFFNYHLKPGSAQALDLPEATVFETGSNRWRTYAEWPPKEAAEYTLHFRGGFALSPEPPGANEPAADEYPSDPAKPVPYYPTNLPTVYPKDYPIADQRFAARRPDVLVYQTDVLTEDTTVVGPIPVTLYVSTTSVDADFVVKLIDVHPNDAKDPAPNPNNVRMAGYQELVRGDILRGRYRQGLDKQVSFTPNEPTQIQLTMPDVNHTFRKGHRLMVQVQSTWFPLFDRNPQTLVDPYHARPEDYRKATHRLHHTAAHPSNIRLRVMPAAISGQ